MKYCIINKQTGVCVNAVELNSAEQFTSKDSNLIVAPDQTGEIGWTWTGSLWEQPAGNVLSNEDLEKIARIKRNRLLRNVVDKMNPIRWETMSQVQKNNWAMYRQQLLDVPQQPGFPTDIIWPVKP
jgi:hypothetical protein